MTEQIRHSYQPDSVSPPGDTLKEVIEEHGLTQVSLAERMGRPTKTISEIINAKTVITPETALQLERVLGTPAKFWSERERHYQEYLTRQAEYERLSGQTDWLDSFPVRAMSKSGWVDLCKDKVEQMRGLLNYFSIASPQSPAQLYPSVQFRKSQVHESDQGAVAAWLRQGELLAGEIDCAPFDETGFKSTLVDLRRLTASKDFPQDDIVNLCASSGVAVTFVQQLPRVRVNGATRWLSPHKALIQLTIRYRWEDILWFSLFHEAGHILLHGKRQFFLEDARSKSQEESEADDFAANTLIPKKEYNQFVNSAKPYSKIKIRRFASDLAISPSIVVGRLQHDRLLPPSHCNDLRRKLVWRDE